VNSKKEITKNVEIEVNKGLFQNSPNGISVIDVATNKAIKVNKAKLNMLGYTEQEYLLLNPNDTLAEVQFDGVAKSTYIENTVNSIIEYGNFEGRVVLKAKSGKQIPAEISSFLYETNNGEKFIYSIIKDVSETITQNEKLKDQNILLRSIFENSEIGIIVYNNKTWKVEKLNERFTELTGFSKEDIENAASPLSLFPTKQPNGERTAYRMQQLMSELESKGKITHETWHLKKDGSQFLGKFVSTKLTGDQSHLSLTLLEDITEDYKNKLENEESRLLFQGIFENASLGCILVNSDKKIVMANDAYCNLVGYKKNEVIGQNIMSFTHTDDVLPNMEIAKRLLTGESTSEKLEKRYITKNNETVWVRISARAVKIGLKGRSYILAVVDDVTDNIKSINAIKQNEIKLKEAALLAKMGFWEMDFKNNKLTWSDEYFQVFGYAPNEIAPSFDSFVEHVVEEDKIQVIESWNQAIDLKRESTSEYSIIDKDGQTKRVKGAYKFVLDRNGKIEKAFGFLQDVTEKTKALTALKESEERFRRFAENSPNVIFKLCVKDKQKLEYVNPVVERIFGYKPNELLNGDLNASKFVVDQTARTKLRQALQRGAPFVNIVCQIYKANGKSIWTDIKVVPVKNEKDELVAIEGVITNIDKIKKSEQFLLEKSAELETKNKELEQFTYIASHDLRAPVVNMTTLLGMLNKESFSNHNGQIVSRIETTASKMYTTLHDLIDVIALQKRTTSPFEQLDLNVICNDLRSQLSEYIFESKAIIETDYKVQSFRYVRVHLKSILQNLFTNSIKYRSDDRRLKIQLKTENFKDYILLTYTDNGRGIDMKKFGDRIFGMFQVFHKDKNGKGLGLYIIKRQIESLGGKIEVDSILDKGTTFRIYLKTK
jgi:PAS domain S-box-containing protein